MEEKKIKKEIIITTKEEAINSLNNLHVLVYNRIKGRGLGIIENITNDPEVLQTNKALFMQYATSISNDISNTIKRALEYLK
jgi:hypothetical protein